MMQIFSNADQARARLNKRMGEQDVRSAVSTIIENVKTRGDEALAEYTLKFDRFSGELQLSREEMAAALLKINAKLLQTMRKSAKNIEKFHRKQRLCTIRGKTAQIVRPIERVGIYVPGGKAAYPSSVLMNALPAKVAGVKEIIMVTPASGGEIPCAILAAAAIAGVDRVFKIGGAQAVAALAFGTQTVPKVDKIVGPGNAYVAEAKRQVFGQVGIDMVAGPTEVLIIADETADVELVAADLLSQAEHDERAACVLVTFDEQTAQAVSKEMEKQIAGAPREDVMRNSVDDYATAYIAADMGDAVKFSNSIAPEHLELQIKSPYGIIKQLKAGAIFVGRYSPEPLGDYMAGTNHVLPTMGGAAFSSPLSVYDFLTRTNVIDFSRRQFMELKEDIERFAEAEGLFAHASSARRRT